MCPPATEKAREDDSPAVDYLGNGTWKIMTSTDSIFPLVSGEILPSVIYVDLTKIGIKAR